MQGLIMNAEFTHMIKCAECGEPLRLKAGCQLSERASKVHPAAGSIISFIEPCRACIAAKIEPAVKLKEALEALQR